MMNEYANYEQNGAAQSGAELFLPGEQNARGNLHLHPYPQSQPERPTFSPAPTALPIPPMSPLDLMAPGHIYSAATGTGIEWCPPIAKSRGVIEGKVRLWARPWNGEPTLLAEGRHATRTAWEYWYNLEFARSFPQVTHWWFGSAWTGPVTIYSPDLLMPDPESGLPLLGGWIRFGREPREGSAELTPLTPLTPLTLPSGLTGLPDRSHLTAPARPDHPALLTPTGEVRTDFLGESLEAVGREAEHDHGREGTKEANTPVEAYKDTSTVLPWSVVLGRPPSVNVPHPPLFTSVANLPLQLLLAERVLRFLSALGRKTRQDSRSSYPAQGRRPAPAAGMPNQENTRSRPARHAGQSSSIPDMRQSFFATSLVRTEDLARLFAASFGPWQLDIVRDLTPREALCRVLGLQE